MRKLFQDLVAMEGVRGVLLFKPSGELLYKEFRIGERESISSAEWFALATSVGETQDADLVFEKARVYLRRKPEGILMVVMGLIAPSAMIRLKSDILLDNVRAYRAPKRFQRFFRS